MVSRFVRQSARDGWQRPLLIQTEATSSWTLATIFGVGTSIGGLLIFLAPHARDRWLFLTLSGCSVLFIGFSIWAVLWHFRHGEYNLEFNPKTKRFRRWKTSTLLTRSFVEHSYADFGAVRSIKKTVYSEEGEGEYVAVELLFKTTDLALEVGGFNLALEGVPRWRKFLNMSKGLGTESPLAAELRQALAKLMSIPDVGYVEPKY
jgi:hypothetical protein